MILNIKAANEEITRLTAELVEARELAKGHAETAATLSAEREATKAGADLATLALAEAQKRIIELETSQQSANDRALEIAAQAGVPAPVPVAASPEPVNLMEQLNSLPYGAKRQQFLTRNWDALRSGQKRP
jgi:hypothetical protein